MYQSWPLGGTTTASTTGYVQPPNATQATSQWPSGYSQYSMTPEMQQQWAAWASQAQYAYGSAMPIPGQVPGSSYAGVYPNFQVSNDQQPSVEKAQTPIEMPQNPTEEADEEEEFERQFKNWEKAFETWKEQNSKHPDKKAFDQYVKQWHDWQAELLEKKEQMLKTKAEKAVAAASVVAATSTTTAATSVATNSSVQPALGTTAGQSTVPDPNAAANMYYQQSQYMYMQQYMYPPPFPYASQPPPIMPPPSTAPSAIADPNVPVNSNENANSGEAYNYDQENSQGMGGEAYPSGDYQNFGEYGNQSNTYPSEMDQQYQRDMNFSRGRGRGTRGGAVAGRGRRGRGGRWDTGEGNAPNNGQPLLADPVPPFPDEPRGPNYPDGPRGSNYPDGPRGPNYPDGPRGSNYPDGPRGSNYPDGPRGSNYPDGPRGPSYSEGSRGPNYSDGPGGPPNYPDGPGGPPDYLDDPRGYNDGPRDFHDRRGPREFHDERDPPPYEFPTEDFEEMYPPDDRPYPDEVARHGRNFPRQEPPFLDGPDMPFHEGPPLDSYDDHYGPPPRDYPGDRGMKGDRFRMDRDFDPYGPSPFDGEYRSSYPRGRYPGRGRRYPPMRDFDRFGPPPFPHESPMEDFPPDDRFHPYERRGRPYRGGRGRFGHDDRPYMQDTGPIKFETVEYTHQSASTVMGKDFNRPAEYEEEFDEDVKKFRAFDYGHQEKTSDDDNDSSVNPSKERSSYFNYDQSRNRERNLDRGKSWTTNRDQDRDYRESYRDHSRNYDRNSRSRDMFDEKDNRKDWNSNRERGYKWNSEGNSKDAPGDMPSGRKDLLECHDDKKTSFINDSYENEPSKVVLIEDLLLPPKRNTRPKQLVIIVRGLPGSGKTYLAKLIKYKEVENGGSASRILSLDDYFMTDVEVTDIDPDTKKQIKRRELKFEYEAEMEDAYRSSLFKSFKKTIDDCFFPMIIVDAVNNKSNHYEQFWSYAKQRGFQVYICETDCKDPVICHKQNVHNRSLEDIKQILKTWEPKPRHFMSIEVHSLLQDSAITEVEMEEVSDEKTEASNEKETAVSPENKDNEMDDSSSLSFHVPSKWENFEATEEKLDQLDGLRASKKKHSSMEDYLQLPDDYDSRKCEPGKKRVRWADLEERKEQDRIRAIGFVVGQTDWNMMTDPTHADKALTKTKYF